MSAGCVEEGGGVFSGVRGMRLSVHGTSLCRPELFAGRESGGFSTPKGGSMPGKELRFRRRTRDDRIFRFFCAENFAE